MKTLTLKNGMRIVLVSDNSLGFVEMRGAIQAGRAFDRKSIAGALIPRLLTQGTGTLQRRECVQRLEDYALEFEAYGSSTSPYFMVWEGRALPEFLPKLLEATSLFLREPAFPEPELKVLKIQAEAEIRGHLDDLAFLAKHASRTLLFQEGHPYSVVSASAYIEKVRATSRNDLLAFHAAYYIPDTLAIVLVGSFDVDAAALALKETFSSWPKVPSNAEGPNAVKASKVPTLRSIQAFVREDEREERTVFVPDKSDAIVQCTRRVPLVLTSPDYPAIHVAVTVLGGGFWGRLFSTVREKLGLSYAVSADLHAGTIPGYVAVTAHTNKNNVAKTEKAIFAVLDEFAEKGITEEELLFARAELIGSEEYQKASYRGIAEDCALEIIVGQPDFSAGFFTDIQNLTVDSVNKVIRKYLDPSKMKIVRVGTIK